MGFFVALSQAELDALREQAITEGAEGISSVSVDGMSVSVRDAEKRLDILDRLEQRTTARTAGILPIGKHKVISRGLQ